MISIDVLILWIFEINFFILFAWKEKKLQLDNFQIF